MLLLLQAEIRISRVDEKTLRVMGSDPSIHEVLLDLWVRAAEARLQTAHSSSRLLSGTSLSRV